MDSSPMWVRDRNHFTNSYVENPDYMRAHESNDSLSSNEAHETNFRDWTIAFSRKFRSLRVWLCMKWFGREGIQDSIRKHIELAHKF